MARGDRLRARGRDRDHVTDALSIAFAEDQIGAEERERRVAAALHAGRVQQLADLVGDLQLPEDHPATRLLPVGAHVRPETGWGRGPKVALAVAGVLGVLAVGGAIADGADDDSSEDLRPLTAEGFSRFVDDYREEFGTTEVVHAEVMEEYVAVRVPEDGSAERWRYFYYDADGFSPNSAGTAPEGTETVDLSEVDVERLVANQQRALETLEVEDPEIGRVVIADDYDASLYRAVAGLEYDAEVPPHVQIFVTNEFTEQGSLATDLSGDEVLATTPFAG